MAVPLSAEPRQDDSFSAADRDYWAFQPVERSRPPAVGETHPIDAFIAAKLASKDLEIGPAANKIDLLRRVYFDLIGLPPTPEEIAEFVADESPRAFERVVERLLASPHYGERWARHWLDLARYADSFGFKSDETRPNAWRYRDYVIQSLNVDKPYDLFVKEQIAGDELWPESPQARIATAFHRHHPDESNAANLAQRRAETLQDVTDTVGATFLGLTFGCAKCHDHKFDPILQKDYYRLQAFFAGMAEEDTIPLLSEEAYARHQQRLAEWEQATAAIRAEMHALIDELRQDRLAFLRGKREPETMAAIDRAPADRSPFERQLYEKHMWQFGLEEPKLWKKLKGEKKERYQELQAALAEFAPLHPGEAPIGIGIRDMGRAAPATHVLSLANYSAPQQAVEPGFLSILDAGPAPLDPPADLPSTGRRTALAEWLTSRENPLTARVMVNRIWHYHFGQGIVRTPSDFGRMGERPTHPELLDWLAAEFIDSGWSMKRMHRLILSSRTYQQAARHRIDAAAADPFNRLLWRFPAQRLEGEVIRDSMLAVAGMLNPDVGGPSVFPPLPAGMPEPRGGWDATSDEAERRRRSIYIFIRRNARYPMLEAFDLPDTHETCARRNQTTTAPQALALLNDEQTIEWARGFAGRILKRAGADPGRQIEAGYQLAYGRTPDGAEKDAAYTFLEKQRAIIEDRLERGETVAFPASDSLPIELAEAAALVDFGHALLNSNEFVFRP